MSEQEKREILREFEICKVLMPYKSFGKLTDEQSEVVLRFLRELTEENNDKIILTIQF